MEPANKGNEDPHSAETSAEIASSEIDADEAASSTATCDVYISYALRDSMLACFLSSVLARQPYNLTVYSTSQSETSDSAAIDSAKCVVVILSLHYHGSSKKIEELNWALSRARDRKDKMVYVITVDELPMKPVYLRLLISSTCLKDGFWSEALSALKNRSGDDGTLFTSTIAAERRKIENDQHGRLEDTDVLALLKAATDIDGFCR